MTGAQHNTLHSFVPFYACIARIQNMAKDGIRTGHDGQYIHIRDEAALALTELMRVEQELLHDKHKRRKYEK